MSYNKMLRHWSNPRKYKKSQPLHFDTGSGHWPSPRSNPILAAMLDIREWYKWRHMDGLSKTRACIRERIVELRKLRAAAD